MPSISRVAALVVERGWSVRETEALARGEGPAVVQVKPKVRRARPPVRTLHAEQRRIEDALRRHLGTDVKYASMPYPSCGGCRMPGWTDAQNFHHFASHETREAVTDPDLNAWYDRQGLEADDKCAWSPSPFLLNGYGYQYEWSNLNGGCVQGR